MWQRFDDAGCPDPYAQSSSDAVPQRESGIADISMAGAIAVATMTVTELSQDEGAEQLANLLQDLAETGAKHIVLDFQTVQYMDTACLGCLVEALNRMASSGGRIAVASPHSSVQYIFRLTRLDRVFRICSDVMSAMQAVSAAA